MPHAYFMEKALQCAFSKIGITSPNPPVGAVIADNEQILSCGGTQPFGCDHAEIHALSKADMVPPSARMYVTLEPCCHYGKTPPCTNAIIESGITDVYIGTIDPNPLVSGKGIKALQDAGVRVTILEEYGDACRELIRPFYTLIQKKRPHILHKSAMTLDGCTATRTKDSKWITSSDARALVHRLRSLVDAVIIGKGTYLNDNPSLNVRQTDLAAPVRFSGERSWFMETLASADFGVRKENPLRVIIGGPNDFKNANVFFDENYLIFCRQKDSCRSLPAYVDPNRIIDLTVDSAVDSVYTVVAMLRKMGMMYCMIE
ncbi:MAG: bifunctional diaminohydroxyphosphoribosylaminopyrimidine deaminase/5-amino-6-(5-phosphoribosylamino)uracil reductase RibD, partial [Spirochaetota bacterium]